MESQVAALLAALAQGMRLRIARVLIGAAPQGMSPGALCATPDVPGSTLSFHLKDLTHAGLVTQERDGRRLICCQGRDCAAAAAPGRISC
jgi:ArsR family transcriptional regulator, arsenate/arsenite/antimonite-responsive transcriptional repressor